MERQWYYARGNEKHGPVSSRELRQLADSGELLPTDLVWKAGTKDWAPANTVTGLFGEYPSQPPKRSPPVVDPSLQEFGKAAKGFLDSVLSKAKEIGTQASDTAKRVQTELQAELGPSASGVVKTIQTAVNSTTDSLQSQKTQPTSEATGESRELVRARVFCTTPSDLVRRGTSVSLILQGDELLICKHSMLKGDEVVRRYSTERLDAVRRQSAPAISATGFIFGTIQTFRNTDKYGYWDGMAATNLQNAGRDPELTAVDGLLITFRLPDDEMGGHGYGLVESNRTRAGSFSDCYLLLQALISKRQQASAKEATAANQQLLKDGHELKAAVEQRQTEMSSALADIRSKRESTQKEIAELKGRIDAAKRTQAEQPAQPKNPSPDVNESDRTMPDNIELLKKLADLHSCGILSKEEFEHKKVELLKRI